jgi:hypothetical protein
MSDSLEYCPGQIESSFVRTASYKSIPRNEARASARTILWLGDAGEMVRLRGLITDHTHPPSKTKLRFRGCDQGPRPPASRQEPQFRGLAGHSQ